MFVRSIFKILVAAGVCSVASPVVYADFDFKTRTDAVQWVVAASALECRLSHPVEAYGESVFSQKAGEPSQFYLSANTSRMKQGLASVQAIAPPWVKRSSMSLGAVRVTESDTPITASHKMTQRMLAQLQKGLDIRFTRKPWYGGARSITVTLSSVGFTLAHSDYLKCLNQLLPLSYAQVEKTTLYYENGDEGLSDKSTARLDDIVKYLNTDKSVQAIYIDAHTDSDGMREENFKRSQQWAQLVQSYLLEQGISDDKSVVRWHGERYPIATNQTLKGMAKNRRVTLRLSREPPVRVDAPEQPEEEPTEEPAQDNLGQGQSNNKKDKSNMEDK